MHDFLQMGLEIDAGLDDADPDRINTAIAKIDLALSDTENQNNPVLHYFRANAFAALRALSANFAEEQFAWQQPHFSEEILSLRRSVKSAGFAHLDSFRRCQILTNLGNALNAVGRPIEALGAWDGALNIEPKFAMAAGNRAYGIAMYGGALYDPGHQCVFLGAAANGFRVALGGDAIWDSEYPGAKAGFRTRLEEIEDYLEANCNLRDFDPFGFELEETSEARAFNTWRLQNRLFLNPLNDLGALPIAAHDVLHLPNHTYNIDEDPRFVQFYDLMKQEYVAACVLLFEGCQTEYIHPADQTLLTYEHADYSVGSVQIEKQKAAFRIAYSLFDKCAVFINDFFHLGIDPRSLSSSFRRVWFDGDLKKKQLRPTIPLRNWRLRGLYSISLDLFDDEFKEVSSPLAVQADLVRNAVEHRFLSVHEFVKPAAHGSLCESVTTTELAELSLHLLKLARATIMGLSLAVYHHENYLKQKDDTKLVVPIAGVLKKRRL